uniref:Ig-like domain-containing protein n=1 Tax=Ornithorhynchus anatinus TaxID=9258 RepID=A0A6I8NCG6_ORNAN
MGASGPKRNTSSPWYHPLRLLLLLLLLWDVVVGTGSHSLQFFSFGVSEPGPRVPEYIVFGYLDDQLIARYDSEKRRVEARAKWMEEKEGPKFWDSQTLRGLSWQSRVMKYLNTIMGYYNHSGGSHTFQHVVGCEIRGDGSTRGVRQYAYDGQDYIFYDTETRTWAAANPVAKITKRLWEADTAHEAQRKFDLEHECVYFLQKFLKYATKHLGRKVPPSVWVTHQKTPGGESTLKCWAHGFYPRDIRLSWWRDGQELTQETEHVEIRPGGDGTYQCWGAVGIPPGEEHRYTCRVEHQGLERPLTVIWEPPFEPSPFIAGAVAVLTLSIVAAVTWMRRKRRRRRGTRPGGKRWVPGRGRGGHPLSFLTGWGFSPPDSELPSPHFP